MLRVYRSPVAFLFFASLVGCAPPTEIRTDELRIRADAPWLEITNISPAPIYTFLVERGRAARILWEPCSKPAECESIAPGQQKRVHYSEVSGVDTGSSEAILYWWHLVPAGGAFRPDSIRSQVVRL